MVNSYHLDETKGDTGLSVRVRRNAEATYHNQPHVEFRLAVIGKPKADLLSGEPAHGC